MRPMEIPTTEGGRSGTVTVDCIQVEQPLGIFYTASISAEDLKAITWVDTRKIDQESEADKKENFESLLGIQRKLSESRKKELQQYVNTYDACFPTAIILSVPERCAVFDPDKKSLTLSAYEDPENPRLNIPYDKIASVLDGQHRIAGLEGLRLDKTFNINVSIFLELDSASEAYIFSVVNQAQTKVNKSLVYDLYSLATHRSPQKLCHQIAVTLNEREGSPFHNKIKRLGSALPSTKKVAITQAAFVESLLELMSSPSSMAMEDRDIYMRGKNPRLGERTDKLVFRKFMINKEDMALTGIIYKYFEAIAKRWPKAWNSEDTGIMLSKTNGFMALMRFLRDVYKHFGNDQDFLKGSRLDQLFSDIDLDDSDFTVENYLPGTSGSTQLYKDLIEKSGLKATST